MSAINYRAELNDEQYAVVIGGDGPCLVLAGAGSGKTRTVVYRVAWLLEHGTAPEEILLLTFTNKAANEMLSRISELANPAPQAGEIPAVGASQGPAARSGTRATEAGIRQAAARDSLQGLWGGTFHSVANRVLRQFAERLGYSRSFSILDQDDAKSLMKACVKERDANDRGEQKFPSPAVIQELYSYSRNAMKSFSDHVSAKHPSFEQFLPDLLAITARYAEKKRLANAMDFDDLLVNWVELMNNHADVTQLLANRFRYVLVDEFQDTNPLQATIVRFLGQVHRNVLVVGDDAQSIYSFRAADIRNILDFPKQWPGSRTFKLVNNYRSSPEIVGLANDVISKNLNQFQKELVSMAKPACRPVIAPAPSAAQEALWVTTEIGKLLSRGVREEQIAVLFRAAHHSQALEFELTKRGIQYDYRGGTRFFERAHIKDVLAYLQLVVNVANEAAWLRILSIQPGIGEVTASKMAMFLQQQVTLAGAITSAVDSVASKKAYKGWEGIRGVLEEAIADPKPGAIVRTIIGSNYIQYLESEYPNYADRIADLGQLAAFADQYEGVAEFLADATLDDSLLNTDPTTGLARKQKQKPQLVLSTIHQAKGLEWDAVFVIHLANGSFPNRHAQVDDAALEEERRLFYVSVTRARKYLYLTYPATVGGYEGFQFASPSVFIEELTRSFVDWQGSNQSSYGSTSYLSQRQQQDDDFTADITRTEAGDGGTSNYDDQVIELDENGDPINKSSLNKKSSWQHKSFLRDV